MNKVILSGRMTRDAEVTEYGKGKEKSLVARFSIAVRDGKDAKEDKSDSGHGFNGFVDHLLSFQ